MKKSIMAGVVGFVGLALGVAVGALSAQTAQTNGKAFQKSMSGLREASQFQVRLSAEGEQTVQGAETAFNHLLGQASAATDSVGIQSPEEQWASEKVRLEKPTAGDKQGEAENQQAVTRGVLLLKKGNNTAADALNYPEKVVLWTLGGAGVGAGIAALGTVIGHGPGHRGPGVPHNALIGAFAGGGVGLVLGLWLGQPQ